MNGSEADRWRRIEAALHAALDAAGADRARVLDEHCGDDAALRDEVEELLRADSEADRFLSTPAAVAARGLLADWAEGSEGGEERSSARTPDPDPITGRNVGPFRIVGTLGEGGMGVVYEAEQEHPRRSVALKLIRGAGTLDPYRLRLFEREAHALGRLVHPGIATLLEAGRTQDGLPYFAMELVRGASLREWLAKRPARRRPVRDGPAAGPPAEDREEIRLRLSLFLEVCDAIAYAHQRGVIHRDIKPSNVVVLDSGSTGTSATHRVKVLDFGLARFVDGDVALSRGGTEAHSIQGTLPYMSPEQARGEPEAIDVPVSPLHEGVRAVCESEPRRPRAASRALGGDLETILLKALEKEPSSRYPGVSHLAEDVRRYLADYPILARPPSTAYQLRKIFARHRGAALSVAALLLVLVLGAAGTTVGMLRARHAEADARTQARTAEAISEYLVGLFEASDPVAGPGATTVRHVLDRGTDRIDEDLADQPAVRARLLSSLSRVYEHLGLLREAYDLASRAIAIEVELRGADDARIPNLLNQNAYLAIRLGDLDEAETLLLRAVRLGEQRLGPEDPEVAESLYNLALVHNERAEWTEGEELLARALAMREAHFGPDAEVVGINLDALAGTRSRMGRFEEAAADHGRSRAILQTLLGEGHPRVGVSWLNTGGDYYQAGDLVEARRCFEKADEILSAHLPPEHPWLTVVAENLGAVHLDTGDLEGARPYLERCLEVRLSIYGEMHPETARVLWSLANLCRDAGEVERADVFYGRSVAANEATIGGGSGIVAEVLEDWAQLQRSRGRNAEAERLETRASAIRGSPTGPGPASGSP